MKGLIAIFALLLGGGSGVQPARSAEHTVRLAEGDRPGAATIDAFAFLAGRWLGKGLGGDVEETWNPPLAGAMIGTFRLIREGQPVFYEFLSLIENEGTVTMKLKHFHPDLVGWEEKGDSVQFRLVRVEDGRAYFHGFTIERDGPDGLRMYLAMRDRDGTRREELFELTRQH